MRQPSAYMVATLKPMRGSLARPNPGIPALDRAPRPVRRYHHPICYNAREGKSGKNLIVLNIVAPDNP